MEGQALGIVVGIAIALVLIAVVVFIFRWLWNSTLPELFGVKTLTFGQALKILLLAGILFGGHRVVTVPEELSKDAASIADSAQ